MPDLRSDEVLNAVYDRSAVALKTTGGGSGASAGQIQGNVGSGVTDAGNPVKVGGVYNTVLPVLTNGQRGDLQVDTSSRLLTSGAPLNSSNDSIAAVQSGTWAQNITQVNSVAVGNNLPVGGGYTEQTGLSTAATSGNFIVASTDVSLYKWLSLHLFSGWTGTITFEGSNDNSNWNSVALVNKGSTSSSALSVTTTGSAIFVGGVDYRYFRARVSVTGTGTITGVLELYTIPPAAQTVNTLANQVGTWTMQPGNTANTTAWLANPKFSFSHVSTNTTTTAKSGAGTLHTIVINTKGITNTATVYDNTAGSGTIIAVIDTTLSTTAFVYDAAFATGLTVVTAGGTAADLTITYS